MIIVDDVAVAIMASVLATSPLPNNTTIDEFACAVEAIHFEASGEEYTGKLAIVELIQQRIDFRHRSVTSICGAIYADKQFSYNNEGQPSVIIKDNIAAADFKESVQIALDFTQGKLTEFDIIPDDMLHYYNPDKVTPSWEYDIVESMKIGSHLFAELANP